MESVRIRIERRLDVSQLTITVTLPNGVYFPLDVSDRDLSKVTIGKSYDCDWTTDGRFLNLREVPVPELTFEQKQRLKVIHRSLTGLELTI